MSQTELLKQSRDLLLKLHKSLLDHERSIYERIHGPQNAGQFLGILLEDPDLAWLRKFSTLIVEIDEMFAQKDGYSASAIEAHIQAVRSLVAMEDKDEDFRTRFSGGLQHDADAAAIYGELKGLLS